MGTVSTVKTQRLLDPANSTLEGQARVNAEIFTAVEILGRKLERVAAERDRLAERLALIESQAAVDEKTGRLYLPVVVTPETQMPPAAALPRWVVSASLASAALALFAVGLALFRPVAPPLTKSQIAVLNALSASQFTQLDPDSEKWKKLAGAQPPAPPQSAQPALAETTATPVPPQSAATQNAAAAMPFAPAQQAAQPAAAPALTQAEETVQAPAPETEAAATAPTPATAQPAKAAAEKKPLPPQAAVKTAAAKTTAKPAAKNAVPEAAAAGGLAPDKTLTGDLAALQARAYEGVPAAQHDLATLYAAGDAVPQNYDRARFWFTKAADQGVANASYNLGVIYHQGLGVTANMEKALYWYKKAADLGHPEAMYNLGIAYIEGIGAKTNVPAGVAYFKRAADAGVAQAAYNLGVLYESNFIGPINIPEAIKWYRIAAKQGHPRAAEALRRLEGAALKTGDNSSDGSQAAQLAARISPAAGGGGGPHSLLADIQRILIGQGLLPGQPDGILTQQTEDAISGAEKKLGMTEDGQPSETLLDKLLQMPPAMGNALP